jgi:hypothetical protein
MSSPSVSSALAGLASSDELTRVRAEDTLREALLPGRQPREDLVTSVAKLAAALESAELPDRARLVDLLVDAAQVSPRSVALDAALAAQAGQWVRLLEDPEPRVRAGLVQLASLVPSAAGPLVPALQRRALEDEAQVVRLGAVLALSKLKANVVALTRGLFSGEQDALDRFLAVLALAASAPAEVTPAMLDFALGCLKVRSLLLRSGEVPLVDNPRAMLASALSRHPDAGVRDGALARLLGPLQDDWWLDDATARAVLRLAFVGPTAPARLSELQRRAVHLVGSRALGPTGSLDLLAVLRRAALPTDRAGLQHLLGPAFPLGQSPGLAQRAARPWWRFWS